MQSEREVQDYVSDLQEEIRYRIPSSLLYHTWWNQTMLSLVNIKGKILDCGCGTGILANMLQPKSGTLIGLDLSFGMLKHAKNKMNHLTTGDVQKLPFQTESFDLLVGRSLLHHIPNPEEGVAEMARVLKPNAEIVLVDTNRSLLSTIPRLVANRSEHFSEDHKNMRHTELVGLLEKHFIVDKVLFFGYLAYPIGFPDILDISRFLPFPIQITKALIQIDRLIGSIPLVKRQSWGLMVKGRKIDHQSDSKEEKPR